MANVYNWTDSAFFLHLFRSALTYWEEPECYEQPPENVFRVPRTPHVSRNVPSKRRE